MKNIQNIDKFETLEILYQAEKCGYCPQAKTCPNNINRLLNKPAQLDWRMQHEFDAPLTQSAQLLPRECQ